MISRCGAAIAATVALALGAAVSGQQGFRAGTDLVLLTVSAVTGQGRPVSGLNKEDFHVVEDGVPQEISLFNPQRVPVSLSILIDASSSMDSANGKIAAAKEAAMGFCRSLRPNDVAQIIAFSSDIQIRQTFTSDVAELERAISQTRPGGSTSLYTAIYVALNELKKVRRGQNPDEIRRQAIVVLSDGEDTTSLLRYEEVLELSKREDVAVYAIGIRGRAPSSTREFNESDFVLRTLAQTTGGRAFFVSEIGELAAIYRQIADELASQYTLGFVSKNAARDGKWRQVSVRVSQSNVVARTRSGYFGPSKER